MKITALLLAFSVLTPLGSSQVKCREPRDCNPTTIAEEEICNFHKVDNDLYRGGRPTCRGLAKLEALGIRTFIDLGGAQAAIHGCKEEARQKGIQFHSLKINLVRIVLTGVPDEKLRDLFTLMQRAPKPIFISCSLGRDRTGAIVAIYRVKRGEMSFHEAWQEALYYGYRPRFMGLRKALERYQDERELALLPDPSRTPPPPATVCHANGIASVGPLGTSN